MKLINIPSWNVENAMLMAVDSPVIHSHPLWVFDTELMICSDVLLCSMVLFISGLLCSAGGIGGGGIYVSLLMVAGRLVPHDAVPLSKAVVFFGALASLVLNLRKKLIWPASSGSTSQALIDYSICRIVVPSALVGTLLGVIFNRLTADWVLIAMLCMILTLMTGMVTQTARQQYKEEEASMSAAASSHDSAPSPAAPPAEALCMPGPHEKAWLACSEDGKKTRGALLPQDLWLAGVMLLVIVVCGVLRIHASECMNELDGTQAPAVPRACQHPVMSLFPHLVESMTKSHALGRAIHIALLAMPISVCVIVAGYYSRHCVAHEGWTNVLLAKYMTMGVVTGCLSGLVGIGGGLIFSPFFLLMGVDPRIAVATSSTCVIFTSSSTTLQYLLTDRIIISLAVVYGSVNLLASWLGTSFVHFLQDNFHTRKSYISAIVAAGVFASLVLCTGKLYLRLAREPSF
mmetsp:Transcript_144440/g.254699  ORF Transcript_144440/g.254699 Transcript_144440/m.254699 type:complete len:460 (-) Transcript_144440:55-1434(-)